MKYSFASLCSLTLAFIASVARGSPSGYSPSEHEVRSLMRRNIVSGNISSSYDFVICGGGLAGLVLGSRLSEDANHTVLVLEAGASGDAVADQINIPDNAYYSSLLGTSYDWQYSTVDQSELQNRAIAWSRGKVLGGSSAVNGMYLVRPSTIEVNAWQGLLGNLSGAEYWGWDNLLAAMKKSETFTPPSAEVQQEGDILYNLSSHGTTGPLHSSYPGTITSIVGDWTDTLGWIGIDVSPDADGGAGWGGFIATSSINPSNWTRSYSRSAYIDPLPYRANLQVLPNAMCTQILFGGSGSAGLNATGVVYQSTSTGPKVTVGINKEVILAGGAIGSPTLLMHSGVGPSNVLKSAGVNVTLDLPGVGQHMADHLSGEVVFGTNSETAATLHSSSSSAEANSFINSAIAYANITDLFGNWSQTFQQEVIANQSFAIANLVPSSDPTVIAGYTAMQNTVIDDILMTQVGHLELLLSLTGTSDGGDQSIAIQAALQRPFSAGQLWITNDDPWTYPLIDPWYLSHPADILLLREGLKLARILGETQPLNASITSEISPGSSVSTDNDWDAWLTGIVGTEYHPCCTDAMLPLNLGGVVDGNLRVYGLANVRVADASVFPMQFAAHLQAPTYGLAEIAAEIIRADWNDVSAPTTTVISASSTPTSTSTKSSSTINLNIHISVPFFVATITILSTLALFS